MYGSRDAPSLEGMLYFLTHNRNKTETRLMSSSLTDAQLVALKRKLQSFLSPAELLFQKCLLSLSMKTLCWRVRRRKFDRRSNSNQRGRDLCQFPITLFYIHIISNSRWSLVIVFISWLQNRSCTVCRSGGSMWNRAKAPWGFMIQRRRILKCRGF